MIKTDRTKQGPLNDFNFHYTITTVGHKTHQIVDLYLRLRWIFIWGGVSLCYLVPDLGCIELTLDITMATFKFTRTT